MKYFLGVDVGTSSVRVGFYNENGKQLDFKTQNIDIFNSKSNYYEQSSENIWQAICFCVKSILDTLDIDKDDVVSIGFDATCSLVVLDTNGNPLSVNEDGDNNKNIIMWMDHRAEAQANFINKTKHECLKSVGGKISCEMDLCKILWLKENMFEQCYKKAGYFFALPDYLFWKASNLDLRSMCCVTCKWLYQASPIKSEWNYDFLSKINLEDLISNNLTSIGCNIVKPFSRIDNAYVSQKRAEEMGVSTKMRVGVSLIDAHSGGIGAMSVALGNLNESNIKPQEILVVVSGTSTCHMASSSQPKLISGIWGPYFNAMMPNMWLNEAGQSAAGSLLEFVIKNHPAYSKLQSILLENDIYEFLNDYLCKIAITKGLTSDTIAKLTKNLHYYPDFHGNRSPYANSTFRGSIYGLDFDNSIDNLAFHYLACLQSLVYQSKQIIDHMKIVGSYVFKVIVVIGGLAKNKLYCQLHSDVCDLPVIVPKDSDSSVVLGACISGAANAEFFKDKDFYEILKTFSYTKESNISKYLPNNLMKSYHEAKYKVFLSIAASQIEFNKIMSDYV